MEQIRCTRVGAEASFNHLSYVTVARNWASSLGQTCCVQQFYNIYVFQLSLPNRAYHKNYNQGIRKRTYTNTYRYPTRITPVTNPIPLLYIRITRDIRRQLGYDSPRIRRRYKPNYIGKYSSRKLHQAKLGARQVHRIGKTIRRQIRTR